MGAYLLGKWGHQPKSDENVTGTQPSSDFTQLPSSRKRLLSKVPTKRRVKHPPKVDKISSLSKSKIRIIIKIFLRELTII